MQVCPGNDSEQYPGKPGHVFCDEMTFAEMITANVVSGKIIYEYGYPSEFPCELGGFFSCHNSLFHGCVSNDAMLNDKHHLK